MSFSFDNPLYIGDKDAAVKSDIAELQSEVGDLSQLETGDKSSLVNALNEAIDSTLNGVNRDLSNLSDAGNDKLRSLNSYANEGELLTDAEGLADVKNYAHSTFDASKFTKVGSPIVTEDGIASGFSNSNYLTKTLAISNASKIVIQHRIKLGTTFNDFAFLKRNDTLSGFLSLRATQGKFLYSPDGSNVVMITDSTIISSGNEVDILAEITSSSTTLSIKKVTDSTYTSITQSIDSSTVLASWSSVVTGESGNGGGYSIDLKSFSITVDNIPVFSGNQTGIDTIKEDNYEVVGNPTISDDGVASNFSASNYLTKTEISYSKPWEIVGKFTVTTYAAQSLLEFGSATNYLVMTSGGDLSLRLGEISVTIGTSNSSIISNATNTYKIGWDGTKYYLVLNNGTYITGNSTTAMSTSGITIGKGNNFYWSTGFIDLNSFQVWVDGSLVYQPCLKIPYTLSKTGSKVVNSVYRSRVNDMAGQLGWADYYTLSDIDFTLPQVEVYGLAEKFRASNIENKQDIKAINDYKALNTGDISENKLVLGQLKERAKSTFDLGKFTVSGTGAITDDGIASGADVVSTNNITFNSNPSWCIISPKFQIDTASTSVLLPFSHGSTTTGNINFALRQNAVLSMNYNHSGGSYAGQTSANTIKLNTNYQCKWEYRNGTIYLSYREEGKDWILLNSHTASLNTSSGKVEFSKIATNGYKCDLKTTEVIIDNIPVFSGNKTGIDTIKPDDYTVVGTPTISADGIMSGTFSDDNTAYATLSSPTKSMELDFNFISSRTGGFYIGLVNVGGQCACRIYSNGNQIVPSVRVLNSDNTTTNIDAVAQSNFTTSGYVEAKLTWDGTIYTYTFYQPSTNTTKTFTISSSLPLAPLKFVFAGSASGGVNLNKIKFYTDGDLVYQPCLKIPYTESKTGSKIVNSIYRDRVEDMAEQFGYANYYTLSDTDFTLPQVELYGLIGQRTLRDSYRNGINYWELYSNRDLEQGGSCTSGVEVTFARPFADTNFVLSVPYSAKSATAFTPTQTGDWIAKGKGIL